MSLIKITIDLLVYYISKVFEKLYYTATTWNDIFPNSYAVLEED